MVWWFGGLVWFYVVFGCVVVGFCDGCVGFGWFCWKWFDLWFEVGGCCGGGVGCVGYGV